MDLTSRTLEAWVANMDEEPETERALAIVREEYEELLKKMSEAFTEALLKDSWAIPGLLNLGDMSIQGNIKPARSLVEPLQTALDNGARKALIPIENKRNFFDVSGNVLEKVDPISMETSELPR